MKNFITFVGRGNVRSSVNKLIIHHEFSIINSTPFLNSIEISTSNENLDELMFKFYDLNIIDNIKHICLSNLEKYSFRNCRKLKKLQLQCLNIFRKHYEHTEEMLENNLLFIESLMPDTVERLEISRNFNLSSRITDKLNEYMPNIKMLTFYNGKFNDSNCLSSFKNLEIFITGENPTIEISKTIKVFVINQKYLNSYIYKNVDKKIVNRYCKRFLNTYILQKENIFFSMI
uniref:Leucine-rich repeat protein n=1 Tax=Strongyloides venezuelensis TaxID=75913 RepID=A0A0K0FEJ9_STRVS